MSKILVKAEMILTAIFAVEAFLKVIATGFAFSGSKSYIRDLWNVLDFIVLIISVSSI